MHYIYVPYHAITLGEHDKQLELGLCDYLCIFIIKTLKQSHQTLAPPPEVSSSLSPSSPPPFSSFSSLLLSVLLPPPLSPPPSFSYFIPPPFLSDSFTSVMFFHFSFRFFCLSEYLCSKEPASSPPLLTSAVL